MEQARRILELMFLTAWADGRFEGSEALAIHKLAATVPQLREVGTTGDIEVAARRKLAQLGLETCVRDAAALIPEPRQRELAFQCCAKVSGADGRFAAQEGEVLRLLGEAWNLSREDAERLLVLATR
ncbi:MAG TPA: TerB family tellurite resistance protein [Myxococcales bacterium]|nr:TerB family tellurite resistance protein [Myxococcales bacterium]